MLSCRGGGTRLTAVITCRSSGGGAARCGEQIAAELYELSACTDDSSDATLIITSLSFNAANRSDPTPAQVFFPLVVEPRHHMCRSPFKKNK